MARAARRWWRYGAVRLHLLHEQRADPRVVLEEVLQEARDRHRQLTQNAAGVIANQRGIQTRLERRITERDHADRLARQALVMAEAATGDGSERAAQLSSAAEAAVLRISTLETEIAGLERSLHDATSAADKAKAAVADNAAELRRALAEKEQSLAKLDQAKLHESMHQAMEQIHATVGHDGTSIAQVQQRIEARLERARSLGELAVAVDAAGREPMREVERALATIDAQSRLEGMRGQLGLSPRAIEAAPR